MDGRFVPAGLGQLAPWYLNVFENVTTVQFDHRMVAYSWWAPALWHVVALRRSADDERLIGTAGLAGRGAARAGGNWHCDAACPRADRARPRPPGRRCGIAIAAATGFASRNDAGRLALLSLCAAARRRARASAACSARPHPRRPCRGCRGRATSTAWRRSALPNTKISSRSVPLSVSAASRVIDAPGSCTMLISSEPR